MLEGGKISTRQATFLMTTMIFSTVILSVPAITVKHARQDAWISVILAAGAGLFIARLVTALGLRFPDRTIFEYPAEILGRWPGKLVSILYIMWLLDISAGVTREYSEFLVTAFMPDTPLIIFNLMVVAIAAYTVRNGLEVFTRANEIFFPMIMGMFVVSLILSSKDVNYQRLLPLADAEFMSLAKGAVVPLAWFGEIVTITAVIPYLNRPRDAYRVAGVAVLTSSFILLMVVVEAIAVFGPDLTEALAFPGLNRYRLINIANFLGRLEAVTMAIWVSGGFVKVSVFFWGIVLGIAQVLELKDYRPLVLPIGALLLSLSILNHPSAIHLMRFATLTFPPFVATFAVVIPLLLLVTTMLRGKGGMPS